MNHVPTGSAVVELNAPLRTLLPRSNTDITERPHLGIDEIGRIAYALLSTSVERGRRGALRRFGNSTDTIYRSIDTATERDTKHKKNRRATHKDQTATTNERVRVCERERERRVGQAFTRCERERRRPMAASDAR